MLAALKARREGAENAGAATVAELYRSGWERHFPQKIAEARRYLASFGPGTRDSEGFAAALDAVRQVAQRAVEDGLSPYPGRNKVALNYFADVSLNGSGIEKEAAAECVAAAVIGESVKAIMAAPGKPVEELDLRRVVKAGELVSALGSPDAAGAYSAACRRIAERIDSLSHLAELKVLGADIAARKSKGSA
jgi:hypothetical protein